ncbi:hypothetical protein RB195_017040 [Necator americanus]|uniref:Uncharacterized protein n=1 Tax=Necator americanus TaxID=51031 RepID=A0ABR1C5R2_NECAM
MIKRTTATVGRCTISFKAVIGLRLREVARSFIFKFAIDDIMRRTDDQYPPDIILATSVCPLTDFEYTDDDVLLTKSSADNSTYCKLISK